MSSPNKSEATGTVTEFASDKEQCADNMDKNNSAEILTAEKGDCKELAKNEQDNVETNNAAEIPTTENGDRKKSVNDDDLETKNTANQDTTTKKEIPEENKDGTNNDTETTIETPKETTISVNPDLIEDEENNDMLKCLRGDAIGNTMYSERFVISTLLKLRTIKEPLNKNEKLEKELETLWDMTIECDVVMTLMQFDVFEVFTECIMKYSTDVRLIEILIGIVGNMCTVVDHATETLSKNEVVVQLLLQLINSSDSCILIQLMRLLTTVYTKRHSAIAWNQQIKAIGKDFLSGFSFILNSSNNSTLLSHALETLNAILAKCACLEESQTEEGSSSSDNRSENRNGESNKESDEKFLDFFVNKSLITASIEAFRTLHTKETTNVDNIEEAEFPFFDPFSEVFKKAIILFLNINDIFLNYTPTKYTDDCEHALETCLNIILSAIATRNFVLFSNIDYLQNILECIGEIYLARPKLHNEDHTYYVIKIWEFLDKKIIPINGVLKENDIENDNFENELVEPSNELCHLTEELLRMLLQRCSVETIPSIFRRCDSEIVKEIFELYGVEIEEYDENELDVYCAELGTALHGITDET